MYDFKILCPVCNATHNAHVLEVTFSDSRISYEVKCDFCHTNFVISASAQISIRKHPERKFPLPVSHKEDVHTKHIH